MEIIKQTNKTFITVVFAMLALIIVPDLFAEAIKIDDVANNLTGTTKAIGSLFGWVVAFSGGVFAFLGIVGLKKYADDARQNPLMKPLIMFVAGSLALGFTVFTGILTKTTTDSEQENEDVFKAE
jgi:amino acid transporter